MNIKYTKQTKGLAPFEWLNIPSFAVLTGLNGAGKSQFLQLLAGLKNTDHNGTPSGVDGLTIEEFNCDPSEVSYLTGEWQLKNTSPLNLQSLQTIGENIYKQIREHHSRNPKYYELQKKVTEKSGRTIHEMTATEFAALIPADFLLEESSMPEQMTKIFIDYQKSHMSAVYYEQEEDLKQLGRAPWTVLDQIIKESNLPFSFNNPDEERYDFMKPFQFNVFDLSGNEIQFSDLSSGEKVLVSLVLQLYNSNERGIFPKLLLMDEPDAHLHPSMTSQFLRVIKNVLVDRHGAQVIMTTHSPSTIALTPEESVFVIEKPTRIFKPISKSQAISLLTAGLVFVTDGTKTVIVEDELDVTFYNEFYTQLLTLNLLEKNIPIVFIPASSKMAEKSGGKTVVNDWAGKFFSSGHGSIIQGLIDRDSGNDKSDGVHLLKRYSIENYFIDPIVVYAALLATGKAPVIEGVNLSFGDEHMLKEFKPEELQRIVDKIHAGIEPFLKSVLPGYREDENELYEEVFTSSVKLQYPKYLAVHRGKDLVNAYCSFFKLRHQDLWAGLRRVQIIPNDILELMLEIQKS